MSEILTPTLLASFPMAAVDGALVLEAVQIAERFQTSHFDAQILAAAKRMGCATFIPKISTTGRTTAASGRGLSDANTADHHFEQAGFHALFLKCDRKGQHSIRANQQWRVCFRWTESGPADVDYH